MKTTHEKNLNYQEKQIVPDVDTYETAAEYILNADMPGVGKENLDILVEEDILTIKGSVTATPEELLIYQEFTPYSYLRSFKIGYGIDRDKIEAKIENGVLTLTLPKTDDVKPKKIEID